LPAQDDRQDDRDPERAAENQGRRDVDSVERAKFDGVEASSFAEYGVLERDQVKRINHLLGDAARLDVDTSASPHDSTRASALET
jgi:hypothetical protein